MKEILAGRYEVGELIGRGGMANVYRGTDATLGRTVAIKVLSDSFAADPDFVARFRREAQAAAKMNHPNVVNVYDSGADDGTNYIVMEFVQGRTLAEIIAHDGRLMPERSIEIAEAVCDALAFAHREGIVHRDIKPGNIMVTSAGEVKLMDFGIARQEQQETVAQTAAVLGTAQYLSPEQARGEALDLRSDIYSLGVVLYEMLVGKPPFAGDSAVALAMAHVQEAPVPPSQVASGIPSDLDSVVMRALAKNPDNRYGSTLEFKQDLERVRAGQAVAAPPVAATQVITPPTTPMTAGAAATGTSGGNGGSKGALWAIIALIVVALIVLALVLFNPFGGGSGSPTPSPSPSGPETVQVPNVEGDTLGSARTTLEDEGFTVEVVKRETTDPNEVGVVLKQDPAADEETEKGSTITLTVGKEKPEETTTVPNLYGLSQTDAGNEIVAKGLVVGKVKQRKTDEVDPGEVFEQSPSAGSTVAAGSSIDLIVSSGAEKVEVPDLVCSTITKAQNTLAGLGLQDDVDPVPAPNPTCPHANRVGAQDPAPGTLVQPGTTVTIQPSGP